MDVLIQVLNLFLLMAAGYFIAKTNLLGTGAISGLNKLVIYFTLPCLTFAKLQQPASPSLMGDLFLTFCVAASAMLLSWVMGHFLFRREPAGRRAVFTHVAIFSNSGFMGYPILAAALGEENLIYGVMFVAAFNVVAWTLGAYLYAGKEGLSLKRLCTPALLSVLLGIIFFVANIRLPKLPLSAIAMLGDTTTPLSMLVVGARLYGIQKRDLSDKTMLGACGLRLIVVPLTALGLMTLLGLPFLVKATVFVCLAMPGASVTAMQAEHFKGDGPLASRTVAVSTALSVLTIPLVLLLI